MRRFLRACAQLCLQVLWCSGGGVFVSPAPAYADGYVSPDGNNIYYGYKSDANYSKDRFKIEVHYYNNSTDAENDTLDKQDPLGQYVHVKYIANLHNNGKDYDYWAFRPMWWYGVPAGLTEVHDIDYGRFEPHTQNYNPYISHGIKRDDANQVKHYDTPENWKSISNFYIKPDKITSAEGVKKLVGIDGGTYDNSGNTSGNWDDYKNSTSGMSNIFIDWESSGKRYYVMTYVAKMTEDAWKQRDVKPLRFAAGVYRIAGNWHIATAQTHRAPKIADSLKVKYPDRTPVKNKAQLDQKEKTAVKKAITDINSGTLHFNELLNADTVNIADNGTATLTFKDNTTLTMPGDLLVMEQAHDCDQYPPTYPAPIGVVSTESLSDADQKAIIDGFKSANKDNDFSKHVNLSGNDTFTFDNTNHQLKIKYNDNSTLTIPYDQLVYQGSTIADWAPYVVPDYTEVGSLTAITAEEINSIKTKFDAANKDLDVYKQAKTKNKDDYLTINASTGDATIKWEDGSKTVIGAWQFLKEAKKAPVPVTPTPVAEEKTFTVDAPETPIVVTFDPFKTTSEEISAGIAKTSLDGLKNTLKKLKGKDSKDNSKEVTITDVEYSVDNNGVGYITFKAKDYKDAKYPMGAFFKQNPNNKVLPQAGTTTQTVSDRKGYKYNYTKFKIQGSAPTTAEKNAAVKQFVKDNYNGTINDCSNGTYMLNAGLTPKDGTQSLAINNTSGLSKVVADSTSIKVYDKSGTAVITISDPYEKNQGQQGGADTTLADLKKQAKALLTQKRDNEHLSNNDLTRAGIKDADKLNDSTINGMDEKALRKLIAQLTNAKHIERNYNAIGDVVVKDPTNPTDDDFKKAVKAFLDANYTGAGDVNSTTYSVPSTLKPKPGTVDMEPYDATNNPFGITTISKGTTGSTLTVTCKDNTTFTVNVAFKKKEEPKTLSTEQLQQMKNQAKDLIDHNPNLTPEQKKKFKDQIDDPNNGPKNQNDIQNILNQANTQANTNKTSSDPNIKKHLKDNTDPSKAKENENLKKAKEVAKKAIDQLNNLTPEQKKQFKDQIDSDTVTTPDAVQNIVNQAIAADSLAKAKKDASAAKDALRFLCKGNGTTDADDKALKELIGADPSKKDSALAALEAALNDANATADSINKALDEAKRQNGINEQAARQAANAKIAEFENKLQAAEKVLKDNTTIKADDKNAATSSINEAKTAIATAKTQVASATTPSGMLTQLSDVKTKFKAANDKVNDAVNNAQNENKKHNTNDPNAAAFEKEKNDAKNEIDKITDLTPAEKQKYKDEIDQSTHKGDPETFVNRAKKNKKIKEALAAIEKLEHLNNAQKKAYEDIINSTDAYDHKNVDGTTTDDIDDALKQAKDTDTAMKFLGDLKQKAEDFKNTAKYTGATDPDKKSAFDKALQAAEDVLKKETGAPKSSVEVNKLYNDLLQKMKALDTNAAGATVTYAALQEEVGKENTVKESDGYKYSDSTKQNAYTNALSAAKAVLTEAKVDLSGKSLEELQKLQQKVDDALAKLKEAEKALDGKKPAPTPVPTPVNPTPEPTPTPAPSPSVDKSHLQQGINGSGDVHDSDDYNNAPSDKKQAYDHALDHANEVNKDPNATQDQVNQAAEDLKKAQQDLHDSATVDKSYLQWEVSDDVAFRGRGSYLVADASLKDAYKDALSEARSVLSDPNATQAQVNAALAKLREAKRNILQANGLSGEEYAGDGTPGTGNTGAGNTGTGNTGAGNTGTGNTGTGNTGAGNTGTVPGSSVVPGGSSVVPGTVPGSVPGSGNSGFGSTGSTNAGTTNSGSGHEGDSSHGFGVNDNAPTTVDKGELNLQIEGAESGSKPGSNSGAAGNGSNSAAGSNASAGTTGAAGNAAAGAAGAAGNAAGSNAGNAAAGSAAANGAANGLAAAKVNAVVENSKAVKRADAQVAAAEATVNTALAEAKKVAADPNATQAQVDAAAQKLADARKSLAAAQDNASRVRAVVREQVLKRFKGSKLSKTGSDVSVFGVFAAGVAAAGAALFVSKRRGISRHSNN